MSSLTADNRTVSGNWTWTGDQDFSGCTLMTMPAAIVDLLFGNAANVTAFAGGGQGSATAITANITEVGTVATAADSVKVPVAVAGQWVILFNNGANAMDVFPETGDNIGAGINTAISVPAGSGIALFCYEALNYRGFTFTIAT